MKPHKRGPTERPTPAELRALQERLGYTFTNEELLTQALTHSSVRPAANMGMLELLGDTAVNHIIGLLLAEKYPTADRSDIARMRGRLKTNAYLATIALRLHVKSLFRRRHDRFDFAEHILGSMVEAIIGAIEKDADFECAKTVCHRLFEQEIELVWYDDPLGQLTNALLNSHKQRPRAGVQQKIRSPDGSINGYVGAISMRAKDGKRILLGTTDAFRASDAIEWTAAKALHSILVEARRPHSRQIHPPRARRIRAVPQRVRASTGN